MKLYREVKTCDRLPTFTGVYLIRRKDGKYDEAFFKHYALEGTWAEFVDVWFESTEITEEAPTKEEFMNDPNIPKFSSNLNPYDMYVAGAKAILSKLK